MALAHSCPVKTHSPLRWEKIEARSYRALLNGVIVAEAHNTSATGTDNYPWDWYLIGNTQPARPNGRQSGVADTLRSAKDYVASTLGVAD